MKHLNTLKIGFCLFATVSLSACLGSGGGGGLAAGGGGAATGVAFSAYQAEFDRVTGQGPTQDMPTSLNATYAGTLRAAVSNSTGTVGEIMADVSLDVDWTDGQMTDPFSGGARNFRGTNDGGTTLIPIDGELAVDSSFGNAIQRNVQVIQLPPVAGGGTQSLETGAFQVNMIGDLTSNGETAQTFIQLGGAFFGPGGQSMVGPAVGGYNQQGTPLTGIFDGSIGGTHYLERQ